MTSVAVVGAGVIGLCTALELARRDLRVTIIDADEPGAGTSSGNAGWIVPSLAGPVPAPGVVATGLRWMLRPDSLLALRPRLRLSYGRWLYRFWQSTSPARYAAGLAATARLAEPTFDLFDRLAAEGVAFEMHRDGVLFAYEDVAEIKGDRSQLRLLEPFGYQVPEPISGPTVLEIEPALSNRMQAAFVVEQERSIRPESLVAGRLARLRQLGVEIHPGTPCTGLQTRGDHVAAATTPDGELAADAFVIAAGVATARVLASAGVHLPIEGGKGYSIDYAPPPCELRRPVYLHEKRLAITPFGDAVRVAGRMELGGSATSMPDARLRSMARAMGRAFDGWPVGLEGRKGWAGVRPMTPDGLPVIGMIPGFRNLAVASGHAMLGVTLAPATAVEVARLVTTGQPNDVLRPFDPARWLRPSRGR